MLEVKNLRKVYTTDNGAPVEALAGVSIKFPEKGMVFILGKSGSGKSTLLNLVGGLDRADEGEIIVKGKSSSDFTQKDFDSYRNTYVGFVFQEFNILEEFTIAENIGLALELQDKPAKEKQINELLELVDLKGLGPRKPNTLSGGQRQRVAIARALIKNPELIMADEPTGALDSSTGKQVMETLKKLSKEKLVLVVSHDRDSAEKYGDRIIEIADGRVISDTTKNFTDIKNVSENVTVLGGDVISIKNSKDITEDEAKKIVEILREKEGETLITVGEREVPSVKRVCRISEGKRERFEKTDENDLKEYVGEKPKLINAKLPSKKALKIGISGLKAKPIRFIFTVFLSVVAFAVFGVFSTLMLYNSHYSVARSLEAKNYQSVSMSKSYQYMNTKVTVHSNGSESVEYSVPKDQPTLFSQEELDNLNKNNENLKYAGVFNFRSPTETSSGNFRFGFNASASPSNDYSMYFSVRELWGFTDCGSEYMQSCGYTLIEGKYPEDSNGIAISEYVFEFLKYCPGNSALTTKNVIGRTLQLSNTGAGTIAPKITGVYKISDLSKYEIIKDYDNNNLSALEREALRVELQETIRNSMDTLLYVHPSFYTLYQNKIDYYYASIQSIRGSGMVISTTPLETGKIPSGKDDFFPDTIIKYNLDRFTIYNAKHEKINFNLKDNQMLLSKSDFNVVMASVNNDPEKLKEVKYYVSYVDQAGKRVDMQFEIAGYYEMIGKLDGNPKVFTTKALYTFATIKEYSIIRNISSYVPELNGKYNFVVTPSENTTSQVKHMLSGYNGADYKMMNAEYESLFDGNIIGTIKELQLIFLVGGVVMGIFAALMLLNFISASITAKRKEIGILRAVGAGKSDIFKIFFTESMILTAFCFLLATAVSWVGSIILNNYLAEMLLGVQLLEYGLINILLILFISFFISTASTVVPVIMEARKSPVEGIRSL